MPVRECRGLYLRNESAQPRGLPGVSLGEPVSLTLRSALTYHRIDVLTAMDL